LFLPLIVIVVIGDGRVVAPFAGVGHCCCCGGGEDVGGGTSSSSSLITDVDVGGGGSDMIVLARICYWNS
jgi:hypothetical protein